MHPVCLLAICPYGWQVADSLNSDGVACNLVTGQEVRQLPGAKHTACTVEMAQVNTPVEVCYNISMSEWPPAVLSTRLIHGTR